MAVPDFVATKGTSAGVEHAIAVPDSVFKRLCEEFNNGAKMSLTGKKDGTNRLVVCDDDGRIRDLTTGRIVYPLSRFSDHNTVPVSKYGEEILNTKAVTGEYKELFKHAADGTFIGTERVAKKGLTEPPTGAVCAACAGAGAKRCARCKLVFYCSATCQKNHWAEHRKTCAKMCI
jgi:hypothetical protein